MERQLSGRNTLQAELSQAQFFTCLSRRSVFRPGLIAKESHDEPSERKVSVCLSPHTLASFIVGHPILSS